MIHLICALRCEAQPLIEHYRMTAVGSGNIFDCYIDRHHGVSLTISGPGKTAAASAVIQTHMLLAAVRDDSWVNIGIAGHDKLDVGSPVVAHKVIDYATGRTWYPQLLFDNQILSGSLITLDGPSDDYHDTAMYDMEAAGFYDAVSRTSTLERCHSLKIISDNRVSAMNDINKKQIRRLIELNLGRITDFVTGLDSIASAPHTVKNDDPEYRQMLERYHFTHSQKLMLKKLLQRWRVLSPGTVIDSSAHGNPGNSRELIACIKERLDAAAFRF